MVEIGLDCPFAFAVRRNRPFHGGGIWKVDCLMPNKMESC